MGCLLQVTAGSVVGAFGQAAQDCAKLMLERRWVAVIATDAHNLLHRAPLLAEARKWLQGQGWDDMADELTRAIPAKILGINATHG